MGGHVPLQEDLRHGQISDESHLGGLAESASHCAAHLGRDAQRVADPPALAGQGEDDGLGLVVVGESDQELRGAVTAGYGPDGGGSGGRLRKGASSEAVHPFRACRLG